MRPCDCPSSEADFVSEVGLREGERHLNWTCRRDPQLQQADLKGGDTRGTDRAQKTKRPAGNRGTGAGDGLAVVLRPGQQPRDRRRRDHRPCSARASTEAAPGAITTSVVPDWAPEGLWDRPWGRGIAWRALRCAAGMRTWLFQRLALRRRRLVDVPAEERGELRVAGLAVPVDLEGAQSEVVRAIWCSGARVITNRGDSGHLVGRWSMLWGRRTRAATAAIGSASGLPYRPYRDSAAEPAAGSKSTSACSSSASAREAPASSSTRLARSAASSSPLAAWTP